MGPTIYVLINTFEQLIYTVSHHMLTMLALSQNADNAATVSGLIRGT